MKSRLEPNECADLTERGERHFHAEPCEPSELERLRAENLRLTADWMMVTAERQLALREVERLREKLAVLMNAFNKIGD